MKNNGQVVKVIRPFGPSIAKTKMPKELVDTLNEYIDQIIPDEDKSVELNLGSKLAGHVKQEFKLENNFIESSGYNRFLASAVLNWINLSINKKIKEFKLINTWVVRQFQNEYNPIHVHGGHISGVGYLKIPKTVGKNPQKEKKINYNGKIELIHGSKQFLSNSTLPIEPEVGDFYFFPHYLMHTVYPFYESLDERRSISFNAEIDKEIFNVFTS